MRQLTVSLPDDLVEEVESKVRNGEFSSTSDFVEQGIVSLLEAEKSIVDWLRQEVAAGHAEYLADPSQGIPADQILDRIRLRRAAARP